MSYIDDDKLQSLQKAGQLAAQLHQELAALVQPGRNVLEIEAAAKAFIEQHNVKGSFFGFHGYPAITCISIDETIVHGIPTDRILKEGEIIAIDLGITVDGWIVDTARTHPVGKVSSQAQKLISITQQALDKAIDVCRPGKRVGDIGHIVAETVEKAGFAIIPELNGHGVGRTLQEPPSIPNFGQPDTGVILKPGMVLAIEPITAVKPVGVKVLADQWTIASDDPTVITAHIEDTVIVTDSNPIIVTREA